MPSLFVLVVYCTLVKSLTARTSAPTTAALDGSETRPFIFPLGDCANSENVFSVRHMTTGTKRGKHIWALQRPTDFQVTSSVNSHEDPRRTPRDFDLILGRGERREWPGYRTDVVCGFVHTDDKNAS